MIYYQLKTVVIDDPWRCIHTCMNTYTKKWTCEQNHCFKIKFGFLALTCSSGFFTQKAERRINCPTLAVLAAFKVFKVAWFYFMQKKGYNIYEDRNFLSILKYYYITLLSYDITAYNIMSLLNLVIITSDDIIWYHLILYHIKSYKIM